MSITLNARKRASDSGVTVKYTPCAKTDEHTDEDNVEEEISVINKEKKPLPNDDYKNEKMANQTANGPRHLPSNAGVFNTPHSRWRIVGDRMSSSSLTGRISLSSPAYSNKTVEQKSRSTSKNSLLDLFGTRIDRKARSKSFAARGDLQLLKKVRSGDIITPRELRKQRKKDIEEKFGKKSHRTDKFETLTNSTDRDGCNWTFVFDPSGRLAYWWSSIVSIAFLYNFWVIIYRFAFREISSENLAFWFILDYTADLLYILDVAFHFRTGYLEDGVLQTDTTKLRIHYTNSTIFYIDCLCLLPLDFLYLSIGFCSILRCFRLVKVYRFWAFLDRTERHTNYPNLMRTATLMHYLLALFHWNACLYYIVATKLDRDSRTWEIPKDTDDVFRTYLHGLYWSTLTLTTIGNLPTPATNQQYVFIIFEMIFGLLLFATVLGHIANIVTNISAARKDFQAKLDGVKTYMSLRRVPIRLQDRVIKWFDYLWYCNKSTDEEKTLVLLPDKLKAEIAIHVHLDTLKRVEIFQNTDAGFLCELVLRLKPVLFSPGDYICRKGEVGKEMYIVNRGRLHVVADNGKTVLATLKPGSYFGEISILNMGTSGNRRTASVRSVGYSDLFRLSKQDLWDVLKEYPAARVKLEAIAVKRLEKTKKIPIEKALARSKSTPGLVESSGKIPLEAMMITRHHTLPAGLPKQSPSSGDEETHDENSLETGENAHAETTAEQYSKETNDNCDVITVGTMTSPDTLVGVTTTSHNSFRLPGYSPPISPRSLCQTPNIPTISAATPILTNAIGSPAQLSPLSFTYAHTYPFQNHPQQMNFLSPYCVSNTMNPLSSPSLATSRSDNLSSSHINLSPQAHPQPTLLPVSPGYNISNYGSVSPQSFSYDTPNDVLLKEINTLRERLVSLETENASMTAKLHRQQWDVEHRLSELELHMCQSSSQASTSSHDERIERFEPVNRESII